MKNFQEKKSKLLEIGLKNGSINYDDIMKVLGDTDVTREELDELYDSLKENKVRITKNDNVEEAKEIFEKHLLEKGIVGYELLKDIYANLFYSIRAIINNKLSYQEIIEKYGKIRNEMKLMQENDRIRIPYYELKEEYYDLLTNEEIEYLLFVIWFGECVVRADTTGAEPIILNGISALTTIDQIKKRKVHECENKSNKEMFDFDRDPKQEQSSEAFGYSEKNPIRATSVRNSYIYLEKLKNMNGEKVHYERFGSIYVDGFNSPIDVYEIYEKTDNDLQKKCALYVYAYSDKNSIEVPDGFEI